MAERTGQPRARREPPPFRPLQLRRTEHLTPHLLRITFTGPDLNGLEPALPAASVRLLLPPPDEDDLVVPTWTGNEFLLPDGRRPVIRTFTPRRVDPGGRELDLDVVLHGDGAASSWARQASPGDPAAVSGPGRGYDIDASADRFLLAGDETAIPAISQLLEQLPPAAVVEVLVEIARPDARLDLPRHPGLQATWLDLPAGGAPGEALVAAVEGRRIHPEARVWVAGEAAAVQRIRRHLFGDLGMARTRAVVRGYWKHGRAGGGD